jgi:hypothetical protein
MKNEEIKPYIDTVDNWKLWKMVFIFPIFIAMGIFGASPFILLGKEGVYEYNWQFADWELKLGLSPNILLYLFLLVYASYLLIVIFSKRNKILSVYINNLLLILIYTIFYFQMMTATQYFVHITIIRYVGWVLFLISVPVILYIYFREEYNLIQINYKKISKYVGLLWAINIIFSTFISGMGKLKMVFWSSIASVIPLVLIALSIWLYSYLFGIVKYLNKVNKNQEKYRKLYGYSVKDWYGSRSKEYLNKEINE